MRGRTLSLSDLASLMPVQAAISLSLSLLLQSSRVHVTNDPKVTSGKEKRSKRPKRKEKGRAAADNFVQPTYFIFERTTVRTAGVYGRQIRYTKEEKRK